MNTRIAAPAPQFSDVAPFPGENRAVIGHNKPPIEEALALELESGIDEIPGLRTRIKDLITKAETLPKCETEEAAGKLGDFINMTKAAASRVEELREKIKRLHLTATRNLDAKARTHTDALAKAGEAARGKLNAYVAEQARLRREAEQAERDRQQAAWQAEQDRIAAEREAARAAQPAAEPEPEPPPAPVFVAPAPPPPAPAPIATGDYGARVGTRMVWRHEAITDLKGVKALPKEILTHPKVLDAINTAIAAQIRSGIREIKGVAIGQHPETTVR